MSKYDSNKKNLDNAAAEGSAEKGTKQASSSYKVRAVPVILFAAAIFTTLCFITGETGAFGSFISSFLKGLFSYVAYTIPAFLALHAICFLSDYKNGKILARVIFTSVSLITLSMIAFLIPNISSEITYSASDFYNNGIENKGGGFVGGSIAFALTRLFGFVGLLIIIALVFAIYVIFFFSGKSGGVAKFLLKKLAAAVNFGAKIEKRSEEKKKKKLAQKQAKKQAAAKKKNSDFYDDNFFYADNGVSQLEIPELGIVESKDFYSGKYILRDSVEHDTESSQKNYRERSFSTDYTHSYDTDINEFDKTGTVTDEKKKETSVNDTVAYAKNFEDDSADAVFTADFDPYDIALNERLASRPSSRAEAEKSEPRGFSEYIDNLTPEEAERLRRLKEFEASRQAALRRREQAEAARKAAEEAARLEAEEERRKEGERLAEEARREEEAKREEELATLETSYGDNTPKHRDTAENSYEQKNGYSYERVAKIVSINSDYENEYGKPKNTSGAYRFVENTVNEVRLPYSSSDESGASRESKPDESPHPITQNIIQAEKLSPEPTVIFEDENYDSEQEDTCDFDYTDKDDLTLEITRSMLVSDDEPSYEKIVGLDFSTEDGEDENSELGEEDIETAEPLTEIPPEERNPKISEYQGMFDIFKKESVNEEDDVIADFDAEPDEEDILFEEEEADFDICEQNTDEEDDDDMPPFDIPAPAPKVEKKPMPKADYSNYKFPPIDLLRKGKDEDTTQINDEIQQGAEQLINTLDSFNITATVRGIERGPRITRYSIVPAKGIRVNQIEKLSDDISLAMAAESIRIEAPIPGKSAVGIEVPNKVPSLVSLRDLLESDEFINEKSKTTVCIGKSVEGTLVFGDIGTMPHLLIAGATGMGKSVCMNSLITSMLYKARPDEVKFIMIDPKKVEFAPYNGIPHLLVPVVTDPKQAAGTLMWAVDEMNKRYDIIEKLCVRGIDSYNEKVAENPELGAPMPKIVIFIDELNDLMIQVRDPVENLIMLIAQKARAAGIHLVIGTQRPSVNVITGVIKANIPSRIACKVSSGIDSRTILEQTGAEKLIGKGDMLFAPGGKPNPKRVQGAFVSEGETAAIVDFIKRQVNGNMYDEQAMEEMRRAAQKCDRSKNGDADDGFDDDEESSTGFLHDRKFLNAVELAIRNGSVATSFLQRKLHIGYGKAAQYIDIMEDLGVVGEKNGSKARDILISMSEWQEKLSRLTLDD